MSRLRDIKRVKARWGEVVLVCAKCSRKLDGGFGPGEDRPLAKALRRALRTRGGDAGSRKRKRDRVAVVETRCLDLCPKGAVVAVRAAEPDRVLVVPRGTAVDRVVAELGFGPVAEEAPADPALP